MATPLNRIIPALRVVEQTGGSHRLVDGTALTVATTDLLPIARLLADRLARGRGLGVEPAACPGPSAGAIHLAVDAEAVAAIPAAHGVSPDGGDLGAERFSLRIDADRITLVGAAPAGLHRAATALAALIEHAERDGDALLLPMATIADGPALAWRGLSFDVVRHAFTRHEVLRVVDLLDRYRMNVLHLHLSDDQGWRLAIPSRPALTAAGDAFFTQEDYEAIVAYAAERFVTVVPEIDMPGHSAAAIVAYPELSRGGVSQAVPADPMEAIALLAAGGITPQFLDPAKEEVWSFVDDVVSFVAAVTPGPFLHIGGDEAFGMPQELHDAFVVRAREIVRAHGKEPIGWQEASRAEAGPGEMLQLWIDEATTPAGGENPMLAMLPPQILEMLTTTFAESSTDPHRMAASGARVIMSRTGVAYLDAPYAEASADAAAETMRARLGLPVYPAVTIQGSATAPIEGIDRDTDLDVVGFEAAIWCETVQSFDDLAFLLLPRLPALAQRAWADGPARDWSDLRVRLAGQAPAWRRDGFAYFPAPSIDWPRRATPSLVTETAATR